MTREARHRAPGPRSDGAVTGRLFRPLLPAQVLLAEMPPEIADPAALHPEERACIERAVIGRRREFAAGRVLARALFDASGLPAHALLPDEDRVPRWPDGVVGSITHCRSLCAVALAGRDIAAGIGLDVEPADVLKPELLPRILRDRERARVAELPPSLRPLGGMLAFSAKEAVYKAIYPLRRVFLEFHDVEIAWTQDDSPAHADGDLQGGFEAEVRVPAAAVPGLARIAGRYRVFDGHIAASVLLPA